MYRHRPSLFWPIILIGVGLIFLLNNLGVIQGNPWSLIWQFWPVILIVIGLDILFGRRSAAGSLLSALLALVVVVGVIVLLIASPNLTGLPFGGELQTQHIEAPLGNIRSAYVRMDFGTGRNKLAALGDSSRLIEGDLSYYGSVRFDVDDSDDSADVRLEHSGVSFGFVGGSGEQWDIGLNQRGVYEMDLNLGVGESDIDLSRLQLIDSSIDVGVGKAEVRLPASGRFRLDINGGIGELRIRIPRAIAVRAQVDTGIGNFEAGSRLRSVGGSVYETEGFDTADERITLEIDVGIGSITIIDE